MNPSPENNHLRDEARGTPQDPVHLPGGAVTPARPPRARWGLVQRITGAALLFFAVIGLGLVALHRTRTPAGTANKSSGQASIHETVTTAPKVRTRKFQAEVVKTKDHLPLLKVVAHDRPSVDFVTTESEQTDPAKSADNVTGIAVVTDADGETFSPQIASVSTTAGNYDVLDDQALLSRVAPRPAMLARDEDGVEHLIFLGP